MPINRHGMWALAILLACGPLGALAQTTGPTAPTTPERPSVIDPAGKTDPSKAPAEPRTTEAPAKVNSLIGLAVFSSDGNKLGNVHSVSAEPDGKVKAIHIKTGTFLGFGGKLVAIPEEKFTRTGDNIRLRITADEVSKLPGLREQG